MIIVYNGIFLCIGCIVGFLLAGLFAGNKFNNYEHKINRLNSDNNNLTKNNYELNYRLSKANRTINMLNLNNSTNTIKTKCNNK